MTNQYRCFPASGGYKNCITERLCGIGVGLMFRRMSHISSDGSRFLRDDWVFTHR